MIEIQNVNFRYSGGLDEAGLHNITLTVQNGEVLIVCGGSGCGKSTLTRLVNGLIPHFYDGEISGKVTVNGLDIAEAQLYDTAKLVGSVFQNPRSQFFNVDATSELAFSCENMGMPESEVRSRVERAVKNLISGRCWTGAFSKGKSPQSRSSVGTFHFTRLISAAPVSLRRSCS